MLIRKLTLRHFRNVPLASLSFSGRRQFFVGPNGQGKSNLLEAAGCLTALRSFRTPDSKLLIMHDQAEAGVACEVESEGRGVERVTIKIRRDGKELWYDEKRVNRLAEHVGRYPTVVFSSQDLQLIRGAPALRRRWLDLTLAAMDPEYLVALQDYLRALAERNSLLKTRGSQAASQIRAFDRALAPPRAKDRRTPFAVDRGAWRSGGSGVRAPDGRRGESIDHLRVAPSRRVECRDLGAA